MQTKISEFEQKIGYQFKNKKLIEEALTHSSFANEHPSDKLGCNERLEFLGDSVLSLVVSRRLFKQNPSLPEGELTRIRASLVCEKSLFEFAGRIELGKFISLGRGEKQTGGEARSSILADCFEAVIAAVFLDGGLAEATRFIDCFIDEENGKKPARDFKTVLQEIVQKNPEERLRYVLAEESGPDHAKVFKVEVHLNSNVIGTGTGSSKKLAEQKAAEQALELMGI